MKFKIKYKKSVKRDFLKISKNKEERLKIKHKIDKLLSENPYKGKQLKGQYKGLYSLHIKRKVVVMYKIFIDTVLVLAIEQREESYKKKYHVGSVE